MANKFAAKDAQESSDDEPSSPFEEIPKPIQRPSSTVAARQEEKVGVRTPPMQQQQQQQQEKTPTPVATAPAPEHSRVPSSSQAAPANESPAASSTPSADQSSAEPSTSTITRSASSAAGGLKEVLGEIRGLLQAQGKQIEALTNEVAELKMKLR
jgi:coronin-1B/1C/6